MAREKEYYLGLDIGTDSVGYAATDASYTPLKCKGEPVMGVMTFEAANAAQERRAYRTARRRIDRRQQRVALVNELFAPEILKIDPRFFIRRMESSLFRDETQDRCISFNDGSFTDKEYNKKYPTIHHLLLDLMETDEPRDVRLVCIACAWLVAHRGHFLFDVPSEDVGRLLDFNAAYAEFESFFRDAALPLPWDDALDPQVLLEILRAETGVTRKKEAFKEKVYGGKKPPKRAADGSDPYPYDREAIVALLSGGRIRPEDVFRNGDYTEVENVSLGASEEDFDRILGELGEDAELFRRLRALHDCAMLIGTLQGHASLSAAKVAVYERHKADLAALKKFVKKYIPADFDEIFRAAGSENYTAYSGNVSSCPEPKAVKKASKDTFSDYLLKKLKNVTPAEADASFYEDMTARLRLRTFLPKQRDTDNRVIPQQLYRHELTVILGRAETYLPFLARKDEQGLTVKEKLLSVFDFRIPYFVGPLRRDNCKNAWIVRKGEGRLLPWNFKALVDYDASEQAFIDRMTNTCSYLAGERVLPVHSLLYCRFTVLNEINNLKVNGAPIPVEVKQAVYEDIMCKVFRPTKKRIADYLLSRGLMNKGDELSGVDDRLNASLSTQQQFAKLIADGRLTEQDAERVIERAAYSEDRGRFLRWLEAEYPALSPADRKYVAGLKLKEFGRLSRALLTEVEGRDAATGEVLTVMQAMWEQNVNLMQLLSDRYTFREEIEKRNREYYAAHPQTLSARLDEMYISSAVKRPIIRTLDICADVVKALRGAPAKIFIEMARDATGEQKGRRTKPRKQQLLDLYKQIKSEDARALAKAIEDMGVMADNRLQSDKLFLYYLQLGRCAYSGTPIDLEKLGSGDYNIDHIYPQSFVKDDSVLNNKVLVLSDINGEKKDVYPISQEIRSRMHEFWKKLCDNKLMTDEKFRRLTRATPFTDEERWGFINRQLVETRQSTKAVAELLQERYPAAEIVYVKAGLVSDLRQEFDMLKSRAVNDLHHAKDAYLNVVVGNVYHTRFTRQWFLRWQTARDGYTVNVKSLFARPVAVGGSTVWNGAEDLAKVRGVIAKDHIHLTRYAFCRHGGLFDQQPVKAAEGLVPLKKGMDTARYGGYNKPTASFYALLRYVVGKKRDIMFVPVELLSAERFLSDPAAALAYAKAMAESILGKPVTDAELLLNGRPIKINTLLEVGKLRLWLGAKDSGGTRFSVTLAMPLMLAVKQQTYVKRIESFLKKRKENAALLAEPMHDHITAGENLELYGILVQKAGNTPYKGCPGSIYKTLTDGYQTFKQLGIAEQCIILINIIGWFNSVPGGCDTSLIGGKSATGVKRLSSKLSNWSDYSIVRIIDLSPAGIFEKRSVNLLDLL